MKLGQFSDEAIQKARQLTADKMNFSEGDAEVLDFGRCQRPDGSYYGTSGQCRKGKETGAKEKAEAKPKAAKKKESGGGSDEKTLKVLAATFQGDKKDFEAKKALEGKAAGEFAKGITSHMGDWFESELRDSIESGGDLDWAMESLKERMSEGKNFGPALGAVAKVMSKAGEDADMFLSNVVEEGALQWARDNDVDTSEWE